MTTPNARPRGASGRLRRPPGWSALSALVVAASVLLAVAGCGQLSPRLRPVAARSASNAGRRRAASHAGRVQAAAQARPQAAAGRLGVLSVSFSSPATGWLLAGPPCTQTKPPCRTLVLRKSADGGRSWLAVPASTGPDSFGDGPAAAGVRQILFTSSRDGWAWDPGLWQTRDGGVTWHRRLIPGWQAEQLVAGNGRVLALAGDCGPGSQRCRFAVFSERAGSPRWRPLPGATGAQASPPGLAVAGGTGYLLASRQRFGPSVLLAGPVSGTGRWRPLATPCLRGWSTALAAAPGGWVFASCGSEPGAGSQLKTAYLSQDGGRTWQRDASPPMGGYLGVASMTPGGVIYLSGARMDVYVSLDRGRSWHESRSLIRGGAAGLADAGFSLVASALTSARGFAFQEGVYRRQIWLTGDGGRRWTPVTVR